MWYYKEEIFTEDSIEDHIGFVYIITELDTQKQYIGQKKFYNKVSRPPLKGKKKRRIARKQSDWSIYYGSNDELKQLISLRGSENYKREIIRLCKSKSEMNYYEAYEIIARNALLQPNKYFNSWISVRIQRNTLKNEFLA